MAEEEYTIGIASGFQVSGKNYYSKNFQTLNEAKEHIKELLKTPLREEVKVIKVKKWILKNLVNVGLLTVKPPHIHSTNSCPIKGTDEKKLVITVAAHKLIWPQTKTYPENAVNINNTKIKQPDNQSFIRV